MKITKYLIAIVALLALVPAAFSQTTIVPYSAVAVGSTNGGGTLSWVIVPALSANSGVPVVTYLNATSDKATSVVQFYRADASATANYVSTTTSLPITLTNGFTQGDAIIVRHIASDTYEKLTTTTYTSATNLTTTAAPLLALAVGDTVYHITKVGVSKIPCGAATLSLTGQIFAGQRNTPLYAELDATSAGTLNAMSVVFVP